MKSAYDIIIVGGGPSGATAAALLAQAGWRIAVVEKAQFPRRKVCGEFISSTTWPLLRKLGVTEALLEIAGPRVRRVGVYAGAAMVTSPLAQAFRHADDGGRAVGREHVDTMLLRRAAALGAEVFQPCALSQFAANAGGYDCIDRELAHAAVPDAPCAPHHRRAWLVGARADADAGRAVPPRLGSLRSRPAFATARCHGT